MLWSGTALAAPQYTLSCSSCHGMPPIDSATRNADTGGFVGNHQTHQPVNATVNNCTLCHNATGYLTTHMNGQISLKKQLNGATTTTTYSSVDMVDGGTYVFKNQTSIPRLGTCSNVNCHFEKTTPSWGSAAFSALTDCSQCHGLPPAGTVAAPGAAGTHATHDTYYAGAANCVKCHADHTVETAKFAHASSIGNRNLIVSIKDPANVAGGAYSGALNDYLPSQTNSFGSCSNLYCHSDGTKASGSFRSKSNATWGGSAVSNCAGCHGGTLSAVQNAISTNRHISHINNLSAVGRNIGCQECHSATTTTGTSITGKPNHVDKLVNIKFDNTINKDTDGPTYNGMATTSASGAAKAPGAVASCANVYCHSIGNTNATGAVITAGGANFKSIAWNGSVVGCTTNTCHGNGTVAYPAYASGVAGSDTANSHMIHVRDRGLHCGYCHSATTASGTAIDGTSPALHINRAENVDFATYNGSTGSYNASKQCSNTYCHSNGATGAPLTTPQWGGALDCRGCHGGDAAHANVINTNKHRIHVDSAAAGSMLGTGTAFQCAACHVKTINTFANNTTITNQALHVNTLKDYSGARAGKVVAAGQCANVYCHSSGSKVAKFRNMTGSKLWTGNASLSCKGCHGYETSLQGADFNSTLGEPNYLNGGIGSNTANNHNKHVAGANFTSTTQCAACHDHTVDRATANKLANYTTQHIDGTRDVIFSAKVGGSYIQASQSCNNTKCHGTSSPPQWGGSPLACNACHGASFTTFSSASKKGAHKQHYETNNFSSYSQAPANYGTATQYQFACASCHAAPAAHADLTYPTTYGVAQVYFGYTTAGKKPAYNYGGTTAGTDSGTFTWTAGGSTSCNNTYCHSNGRGGNAATAVNWGSAEGALGTACAGCHGNESSSGAAALSGRHDSHVNNSAYLGTNFTCSACHAKTITSTDNRTLSDKRNHVNKFRDYSGLRAGKMANFNGTTCSNIYCHSNGKAAYVTTPAWTATASPLTCTSACHTPSLSHNTHLGSTYQGASITCAFCHSNTSTGNALKTGTTTHINGSYNINGTDIKFASFSSAWKAAYSGTTCSNIYCHSNGSGSYQPVQWGSTLTCNSCHPFGQLSAGHAKHIDLNQTNIFYTYTANRSAGNEGLSTAAYRFGCSNCHPMDEATYHTNGTIDVTLKPATGAGTLKNKNINISADGINVAGSGITKTAGSLTCKNVYCHTNGYQANMNWTNTTPPWNGSFANADRCANCHGNSPSVGIAGSPAHVAHVVGIHADDIFKGSAGKLSAGRGGTFGNTTSVSHGSATQATTLNCNICHNNTVTYAYNDKNSSCSTTSCHAGGVKTAQINNRAFHVNGSVDVALNNISVVSKAQLRTASFNDYTAASGYWTRNGGATPNYKNGAAAFDTAKQPLNTSTMWNAGTCSNIACHNGKQVNWNTTLSCEGCHSKL